MFDLVVLGLGAKFPSVIYLVACIPYHTGKATSGSPSPLSLITEIAFSCNNAGKKGNPDTRHIWKTNELFPDDMTKYL